MKKFLFAFFATLAFAAFANSQTLSVSLNINGKTTVTRTSSIISTLSWDIEYGPIGFAEGTGTLVTNIHYTTNSQTFTLNPFVQYTFRARHRSGSTTSNWSIWYAAPAATTVSGDYSFNFSTSAITAGWRGYLAGTGDITQSSNIKFTTYSSSSAALLVMPKVIGLTNHKVITLKLSNFYSASQSVTLGTLSDPYDAGTFHTLEALTPQNTSASQSSTFTVGTSNYNGTDEYIAIKVTGGVAVFLSNFIYKESCELPSNINITNIQEHSANINFDTPYPNTYLISYSSTFHSGSFETISSPAVLENLFGDTNYTVRIQVKCGPNNFSPMSAPIPFTTACTPMSPGYHNGFDSVMETQCWKNTGASTFGGSSSVIPNSGGGYQTIQTWPGEKFSISRYAELDNLKRVRFYMTAGDVSQPVVVGTMSDPSDSSTFVPLKTIPSSEIIRATIDRTYTNWKMYIVDFENYNQNLQHHYVAIKFSESTSTSDGKMYIDDFYFENSPTCKEPLNPRSSLITHNAATIAWNNPAGSSATSWEVEYGPSGFTPGTGNGIVFTTGSNPVTINNIALDNTLYDFYVRINCGNSYSPYSDRGQFKTRCTGITTGYTEGFENIVIEPTLNSCWSRLTTFNGNSQPGSFIRVTSDKAHSGAKSMVMTSDNIWPGSFEKTLLISPRLIGLDSYKIVKFWMYCTSNAQTTAIKIGTISDPGNYQTFTEYQTITVPDNQEGSWIQYTINLANYNLTNEYIAFRHADTNQSTVFYIDDFEYTGLSCPQATNLVVAPVSTSSLKVSWNANTGNALQATEVEMWTSTQGTTTYTTTENPFIISASSGITYTFRVRNICQPGLTGEWSAYSGWTLGCEKFAPYYENFDGLDEDGLPSSGCWALVDPSGDSGLANTPEDGLMSKPRYLGMTDPEYDITALTYLVSPALLDMDNNKVLRFFAKTENFDAPSTGLLVGTVTLPYDLTTFVPFATINTADAVNGKEVEVDFSGYTGTAKHIAIIHPDIEPTYSYIDDILYYDKSTCPPPFNASVIENSDTTVTIGWQAQQSVQGYRIEYGLHGFTPGTGTIVTAIGTEKKITGLQSGLEYDYYIKSQCGAGYSAIVVGPRTFHTACAPKSIPWVEKFAGMSQYGTNILPECFRLYGGSIISYNQPQYATAFNSFTGSDDTFFLKNNDFTNTMILPTFNLVAGTTYTFSLKTYLTGWDQLYIKCSTGRGNMFYNLNINLAQQNIPYSSNDYIYREIKYQFTPIVTGTYSFKTVSSSYVSTVMDDFKLMEGYTSVINSNNQLFDFSGTLPSSLLIEGTTLANPTVNGAVYMPGATSDETWTPVNNAGKSVFTNTPSDIWEANENFITKLNTKIDASAMQQLYMSFDLSQSFTDVNSESLFRVVVNGEVLGNVIIPQTADEDGVQTFQFNLTPYVGGDIRLSLQHLGRHANDGQSLGDTAYLDNLRFTDQPVLTRTSTSDQSKIVVYPNPVKGLLTMQNVPDGSRIEVYSMSGQLLASEKSSLPTSRINMSAYDSGVYMVRVSTAGSLETFKVVKQ